MTRKIKLNWGSSPRTPEYHSYKRQQDEVCCNCNIPLVGNTSDRKRCLACQHADRPEEEDFYYAGFSMSKNNLIRLSRMYWLVLNGWPSWISNCRRNDIPLYSLYSLEVATRIYVDNFEKRSGFKVNFGQSAKGVVENAWRLVGVPLKKSVLVNNTTMPEGAWEDAHGFIRNTSGVVIGYIEDD